MGYADVNFYKNTYHGTSIPDEDIQAMLDRASLDVDVITRRKINRLGGFSQLSEFEQQQVRLATCSQAEHLYLKNSMKGFSSYSIGDVSVSVKDENKFSSECMGYLNATRLTYRGL